MLVPQEMGGAWCADVLWEQCLHSWRNCTFCRVYINTSIESMHMLSAPAVRDAARAAAVVTFIAGPEAAGGASTRLATHTSAGLTARHSLLTYASHRRTY